MVFSSNKVAIGILGISALAVAPLATAALTDFNTDGFMNSAGVITNGMAWGIAVDTGGNGFSAPYAPFSGAIDEFLSDSFGVTDDYFLAGGTAANPSWNVTLDNSAPGPPGPFNNGSGGMIATIEYVASDYAFITSGDPFQLLWHDGTSYGTITDSMFVIGGESDNVDLSAFTMAAATTMDLTADIEFTPEPSAALLSGVLFMATFLRRKR